MNDTYTCSCGQEVKAPIARFVFCHKNQLFYGYTSFATLPNYNAHCATRYKVVVQVESEGDNADFVFWDNECQGIIGKTAEELRETMKKIFVNLKLSCILYLYTKLLTSNLYCSYIV
jgi:hypothetical protein